jgi:protein-S-isoprenylcysteine O-methyltransferase Ste14
MIDQIVAFIARHAGKERRTFIRLMSLVMSVFVFLIAVPMALGLMGHWVSKYVTINIPRTVELSLSIMSICGSLFLLLCAVSVFWIVGRGTPVPFASPTKLVTNGPFRYTRNPIKLGTSEQLLAGEF